MSVQKGFAYFSDLIHELTSVCDVAPLVASRAGSLRDALYGTNMLGDAPARGPPAPQKRFAAFCVQRSAAATKNEAATKSASIAPGAQRERTHM